MLLIDQLAQDNTLRGTHPVERVALAIGALVVTMLFDSPLVSGAALGVMFLCTVLAAGIPLRPYLKLLLVPLPFVVVGGITVAVSISTSPPESAILSLAARQWYVALTAEGLLVAFNLMLRSLSAVSCLYFLALTTPTVELIWILRWLRLPSSLIELMVLTYRFIFMFVELSAAIYYAQAARLGYVTIRSSYRSLGQLLGGLFLKAYYHAGELLQGLEARGYQGELRFLTSHYQVSRGNWTVIAIILLNLVALGLRFRS